MVLQEAVRFFYRQHRLHRGGQRQTLLVIFQRGGRGDLLPGGQKGQVWPHGTLGGRGGRRRRLPILQEEEQWGGGRIYYEFLGWNRADGNGKWYVGEGIYSLQISSGCEGWRFWALVS